MRLFEAIIEANHRALEGDASAGLHPADFGTELPMVALTCIDVRLNRLLPQVLGVAEEQFIWLRNAGNIITGPLSSTMRSLALACALKGGREHGHYWPYGLPGRQVHDDAVDRLLSGPGHPARAVA